MRTTEIHVLPASSSKALDALIERSAQAAQCGNDAESRAYLSGIFEVLADQQSAGLQMPMSA